MFILNILWETLTHCPIREQGCCTRTQYSYSQYSSPEFPVLVLYLYVHEFQSNCTRTCTRTRGQVLRYSYEYWPEYWYSMVHLRHTDENHHTREIYSLTFQIDLFCYGLNIWYMGCNCKFSNVFNSLRPRQNERHFADDIFKCIFLNENVWIPIKISLKFVPQGPINKFPALVQIMAWRRPGDKPLSGPMMVRLPTHICVTRPQWVKFWHPRKVNWIDMMKFVFIIVICPSPLSHSTSG